MRLLVAVLLVLGCGTVLRADTFAYVSLARDKKIAVYKVDVTTGALAHVADTACEGEPGALVANPARTFFFASLRPEGQLVAFRIDSLGTLKHVNTVEAGPDPAQLSTDKEGRFLLAAYYVAGKVTVHAIERDGSLRARPVQSLPTADKAHAILLDPANHLTRPRANSRRAIHPSWRRRRTRGRGTLPFTRDWTLRTSTTSKAAACRRIASTKPAVRSQHCRPFRRCPVSSPNATLAPRSRFTPPEGSFMSRIAGTTALPAFKSMNVAASFGHLGRRPQRRRRDRSISIPPASSSTFAVRLPIVWLPTALTESRVA